MRSLARPVRDPAADLEHCARETRGDRRLAVRARRDDVLGLYADYAAASGQPGTIAESGGWPEGEHLSELYAFLGEGRSLSVIRTELGDAAGNICLLCSMRQVDGLDHHLPRVRHPALSILPSNLVPACQQCNVTKGEDCEPDPGRQFVHPYFDRLPVDVPWLVCQPFDDNDIWSPMFTIDAAAIEGPETLARAQAQFIRLGLANDYHTEAVKHVSSLERSWSTTVVTDGRRALLRQLWSNMTAIALTYGTSHWEVVLLRGLLAHVPFREDPMRMLGNPPPLDLPPEYL